MRGYGIGILLGLTLAISACGVQGNAAAPSATPTPGDDPFAFTSPDPVASTAPDASGSITPLPGASLPPVRTDAVPANNYSRSIGVRYLIDWLYNPTAIAMDADQALVLDAGRSDPRGAFGAVLEFNGRASDAASPVGNPYTALAPEPTNQRLSTQVRALAANSLVVYVMSDQGVFGFMRGSRNPLNLGKPYMATGQDLAIGANTLYVAQNNQVRTFVAGSFAPDAASPSIAVNARGLGCDEAGNLFVATDREVKCYHLGTLAMSFDGRGTDLRGPGFDNLVDVAIDPRNGDIYALERGAIDRFDSAGRFLLRFATTTVHGGHAIALGAHGELYVVDDQARQVLQFDPGR